MSAALQVDGSPEPAVWRQVIDLGARLLNSIHRPGDDARAAAGIIAQHDLIVETAARLVGGQANLLLSESITRLYPEKLENGEEAHEPKDNSPSSMSPLMRLALDQGGIGCQTRGKAGRRWTTLEVNDLKDIAGLNALAFPLTGTENERQEACVLGLLQFERPEGPDYLFSEIQLAAGIASQVSLALQASLPIARERWRQEQLDLVHQVSARIADIRNLDELAKSLTVLIEETFNYYYVAIFTLEPGRDTLQYRASAGPRPPTGGQALQDSSPNLVVLLGQGIIGHVAQSGVERRSNDVIRDAHYRHLDVLPETRSEAALPLKMGQNILGVLDVQSDQPGYFNEADMLVLRALAANVAFAIDGARIYSSLQRRAEQLSAIYEVSNAITSVLDTEELLSQVVELIHKRFGYSYVHLFSVHPGPRKIVFEAGSGPRSQIISAEGLSYDLDDPLGLVPWVVRHADTRLVNDVTQEALYRPSPLPPEDTRSEMTIPLIFGGEVLGVLDVQSDTLGAFSEEDRFVCETLADNIAVALRNAQLYRAEVWRRQVAESMREVVGMLSADIGLDAVLDSILVELERTLPLHLAAIWLVEEEGPQNGDSQAPVLRLSAMHGDSLAELDLEIGCTPEETLELNLPPGIEPTVSGGSPSQASEWLVSAIRTGIPVIRLVDAPFDPLAAVLDFPTDHSAIAAPLKVGAKSFGVLTLAHRSAGRYGREAYAMTETFANYAAVAIENTRLYEAAHEQAWISTVLLQVAEATQELTDLDELLETVIQITPSLTGVKACLLYIIDEEGTFIPAAASGLEAQQQKEFERWQFTPGDVAALDRMLELKEALVLHWDEANLPLAKIFSTTDQALPLQPTGIAVLVPLLSHGEVLGAFAVEYTPEASSGEILWVLDTYLDERLAIIRGIAHQTAVAVENIRLIGAQKEEAYVSVALLQVAQAVVNSPDLQETLGAIVRITPILVGVNRAVIFLWDQSQQVFRSVQSYGTPRDSTIFAYKSGEFPLLDAVFETDRLVAYPLNGGKDTFRDVPDDWSFLIPPDSEEVEAFLVEADQLLLASPLSVKGEVLGVLLVEEPEPSLSGGLRSKSNRRLRSKRLEILRGVSQQSALAIQNDILQHEMVERERLEREFQLARQIQRTFLPDAIPNIEGWDLRVCWRTAREVGGDFYDFFELSANQFGLVIADVADKGMPAAMFMTVVRSLVRATLHVEDSPATVLERVNNLIVPDATQGMFITLVYAVLDLHSGVLEYANAGHNPPLVVRGRTCAIETLERSGMALGVLENTRMQAGRTTLEPGDYLVMYTDGVTEAFSPDGSMFGEERLYATIIEEVACADPELDRDAQHLMDAIDRRVSEFIGQFSRSDDLTLMVLRRL